MKINFSYIIVLMSYTTYYQKKYRRENKDKIRESQIRLYNLYKSEYLPCIFCHKIVQLNAGMNHLKTHKCIEIHLNDSKNLNTLKGTQRIEYESDLK